MIEGRIDSSDSSRLYVTTAAGRRYAVSRSDVVGIDHPGSALIVLGTVATVLGVALLVAARSKSDLGAVALGLYATGSLSVGIPFLIVGGPQYSRSVQAARPVEPSPGMHADALPSGR